MALMVLVAVLMVVTVVLLLMVISAPCRKVRALGADEL
jgi:hypothetical protein